ncbi:cation transporter HKT1;3 [Cryptomeria japonica]|uniref:cation transporter HKT1;3 n=1 Tax=Cryptomeria japonica TaxID=3369 RepID=UPI0027D9F757|nr:cation transporter HKT1;3 [Cryptomeria japonica]
MQDISPERRCTRKKSCFLFKYLKNIFESVPPILYDPYCIHVSYFAAISLVGLIPLRFSPTKSKRYLNVLDAFYTSVSAATVSSLGVVAMEDLSHFHLVVMTILMLLGGEVFTSLCSLHLARIRLRLRIRLQRSNLHHNSMNSTQMLELHRYQSTSDQGKSTTHLDQYLHGKDQMRKESILRPNKAMTGPEDIIDDDLENLEMNGSRNMAVEECHNEVQSDADNVLDDDLEYQALTFLCYLCLGYFLFVQLVGFVLVYIYFCVSRGGERILSDRGVSKSLFVVFTVISSFANCGFTPLSDNMMPLRKHSVLLMILAFQILLGNTMFGPCFSAIFLTLRRFSREEGRRKIYDYIEKNGHRLFADHFFSRRQNMWLLLCAVGFLTIEVVMIFALHWNTVALDGLTVGEKVIGGVFQSVSIRHSGENIVNPQLLSPALLVIYIVFMYLPPYPFYKERRDIMNIKPLSKEESKKWSILTQFEKLVMHDSCYLLIAVILICIIESHNLSQDPLNFNVLAIVFEVVSGYGNVGISLGYNCILFSKMSKHYCEDVPYSLSGKWSTKGKVIIIMVMFFGRLKVIKSSLRRKLFMQNVVSHNF